MPTLIVFDPDGDVVVRVPNAAASENDDGASKEAVVDFGSDEVQMKVSSKHLALASPVFKVLLKGQFEESQSLRSNGTLTISFPDDDAESLKIVFDIIHGRLGRVPRTLSYHEMDQVSSMVDKYELHEVTSLFADIWISSLGPFPESLSEALILLVGISCVFSKAEIFEDMTKIVLMESDGISPTRNRFRPPVLDYIYAVIEEERIQRLSGCFDALRALLKIYQHEVVCEVKDDCDAMVLGGLTRALASEGLFPLPEPPFVGCSITSIRWSLENLEVPKPCHARRRTDYPHIICNIDPEISSITDEMTSNIEGLDLMAEREKKP